MGDQRLPARDRRPGRGGRAPVDHVRPGADVQLGVDVFAAGSAATGLADGEAAIIAARAVQGVGAAPDDPARDRQAARLPAQGSAAGRWGSRRGLHGLPVAGPLLGGLLTEIDWRLVFWVNVPLAAVTILLTVVAKPEGERAGGHFDVPGALTLVPG